MPPFKYKENPPSFWETRRGELEVKRALPPFGIYEWVNLRNDRLTLGSPIRTDGDGFGNRRIPIRRSG